MKQVFLIQTGTIFVVDQFDIFLDQNMYKVWRCGGRLNKIDIPYSSKQLSIQLLHSKQYHLATLISQYAHERNMYDRVKETLFYRKMINIQGCKRATVC